jgi:hypothetical protein
MYVDRICGMYVLCYRQQSKMRRSFILSFISEYCTECGYRCVPQGLTTDAAEDTAE